MLPKRYRVAHHHGGLQRRGRDRGTRANVAATVLAAALELDDQLIGVSIWYALGAIEVRRSVHRQLHRGIGGHASQIEFRNQLDARLPDPKPFAHRVNLNPLYHVDFHVVHAPFLRQTSGLSRGLLGAQAAPRAAGGVYSAVLVADFNLPRLPRLSAATAVASVVAALHRGDCGRIPWQTVIGREAELVPHDHCQVVRIRHTVAHVLTIALDVGAEEAHSGGVQVDAHLQDCLAIPGAIICVVVKAGGDVVRVALPAQRARSGNVQALVEGILQDTARIGVVRVACRGLSPEPLELGELHHQVAIWALPRHAQVCGTH